MGRHKKQSDNGGKGKGKSLKWPPGLIARINVEAGRRKYSFNYMIQLVMEWYLSVPVSVRDAVLKVPDGDTAEHNYAQAREWANKNWRPELTDTGQPAAEPTLPPLMDDPAPVPSPRPQPQVDALSRRAAKRE